jgi:hypothetical protein
LRAQKNILREIFKTSGQSFSILATTATELKNSFFTRKSLKKKWRSGAGLHYRDPACLQRVGEDWCFPPAVQSTILCVPNICNKQKNLFSE